MARLVLVVKTVARAGVDIGSGQSVLLADGAEVANDGDTRFKVVNTTGGAITITFITPVTHGESPALAVADHAVSVIASATRWFGPFPAGTYNEPSDGLMDIDVSADGLDITPVN